jgi:hypothetical protein
MTWTLSNVGFQVQHGVEYAPAMRKELLESCYELSFNMACALIDENRLTAAEARFQGCAKLLRVPLQPTGRLNRDESLLRLRISHLECYWLRPSAVADTCYHLSKQFLARAY